MSSPINVTVTGAAGRMGKRLVSLVHESSRLQLAGATEAKGHPALGRDAGDIAGCGTLGIALTDDLAQALTVSDVVIDFTAPAPRCTILLKPSNTNAPWSSAPRG